MKRRQGRPDVRNGGTAISFIKGTGQRYKTVLLRRDGVRVEVVAGGYNQVGGPAGRIPHDLAHYIVEEEFHLGFGLWGVLSAGALLHPRNTIVIEGRQPPHPERKTREILERAGEAPAQAEIIVRAVADLALAGRHSDTAAFHAALGSRYALQDVTAEQLSSACRRLQQAGAQWEALIPGETIDVVWQTSAVK